MAVDTVAGGCTLCASPDFERGGFGARTMIICDQCEREFHVGCLKHAGKGELDALPEGANLPTCPTWATTLYIALTNLL